MLSRADRARSEGMDITVIDDLVLRVLVRERVVSMPDALVIQREMERSKLHPVWMVIDSGVDEVDVADALAEGCRVPKLDLVRLWDEAGELFPLELVDRHRCVPIRRVDERTIVVGFADPTNIEALDDIQFVTGCNVIAKTIPWSAYARCRRELRADTMWHEILSGPDDADDRTMRLTNLLLVDAIEAHDDVRIKTTMSGAEVVGWWSGRTTEPEHAAVLQIITRLREMAGAPEGAGFAPINLLLGGWEDEDDEGVFYFAVEFTLDDSSTCAHLISPAHHERLSAEAEKR